MGSVMIKLIDVNMIIFIKKSQVFSMVVDNQLSVEIYVLQGECFMVVDNKIIGCFYLDGILLV